MTKPLSRIANLDRYLPVKAVDPDRLVRSDGAPVAVLEVRPVELDLAAAEDRSGLLEGFRAFLNALDHPVQFLVRLTPPDFSACLARLRSAQPANLSPSMEALAIGLQRMIADLPQRRGVLDRRFYLVVPGTRPGRRRAHQQGKVLEQRVERVMAALERLDIATLWLDGDALLSFWTACLRGSATLPASSRRETLRLTVESRSLAVNDGYAAGLGLEGWPRFVYPGWLTSLLTLGVPLDLSLHVAPEETAASVRRIEWQRVQLESSRSLAIKRGRATPPEEGLAMEDLERLRDDLQRGRERLFLASLALVVRGPSRDDLDRHVRHVQAHVAGSLATLRAPACRQRQAHLATLPAALNPLGNWKRVDTSSLTCLFPFAPPDLDTRQGILYGMDIRSGCPAILDPFQEAAYFNANTVVLAQSGAGKSYAVKLLTLRSLLQGVTHYVVDPEGEYATLAQAAGGRVLRPGLAGQGVNPFALAEGDEAAVAYKVGALRRLVEVLVGQRLAPEHRAELDAALTDFYHSEGCVPTFQGFYKFLEGHGTLAGLLRPFAQGSLRFLLGEGPSLDEGDESPITVFDLSHLDPDLRPAVAHLCAEAVWSRAATRPRQRVLVIDEAWALLEHPDGAAFLSGVAKRARKHRLAVTAITQDVQDFLEGQSDRAIAGHSGRTLVQNSAFKLLLRQDASAIGMVEQAFGLTTSERAWLLTCGRGEGLLITPIGRALLRIESSPEEHRLLLRSALHSDSQHPEGDTNQ